MTMTTTMLMFLFWFVGAQLALPAVPLVRLGLGTIAASSALVAVPWHDSEHYALVCAGLLVVGVVVDAGRGLRIAREVAREKSIVV
jgi:hypothetical protein